MKRIFSRVLVVLSLTFLSFANSQTMSYEEEVVRNA